VCAEVTHGQNILSREFHFTQTATIETLSGLNIDLWDVLEVLNESLSFQECGFTS